MGCLGEALRETYIKTHSRLHHATNLVFDSSNSIFNNLDVTHISARNMNLCARVLEIFDKTSGRFFVKTGTANHSEILSTTLHHPFGDAATDAAEAAGQEVRLCRGEDAVVFGGKDLQGTVSRTVVQEQQIDRP